MNEKELKEYAMKRGLNLGQAEKDYFQNIVLFILYSKAGKELVFKGGTALAKCYGLNRFSEDLDFTAAEKKEYIGIIKEGLARFGIIHEIKKEKSSAESMSAMVKIQGPLYKGAEKTLCSITIEISLRENPILEPQIKAIGHHMDIIPVFDVYVMQGGEIMAEKTRAIMARTSARDVYDLNFLISGNAKTERKIVDKKLKFTGLEFDYGEFSQKCRKIRSIWNSELKSLVRIVPDFEECLKNVLEYYKKI